VDKYWMVEAVAGFSGSRFKKNNFNFSERNVLSFQRERIFYPMILRMVYCPGVT